MYADLKGRIDRKFDERTQCWLMLSYIVTMVAPEWKHHYINVSGIPSGDKSIKIKRGVILTCGDIIFDK